MARAASARRYAQAVFELAREKGELQEWLGDLARLAEVFQDREVVSFLENPKISFERKVETLEQHLSDLRPLTQNLARLLIQKNRGRIIPDLVEEYQRFMDEHLGIEPTEIVSAVPLTDEQEKEIADQVQQLTGKELRLSTSVDPEIVGGLIIRMGNKLLDGSTRTRLRALRETVRFSPN